MTVPVRKPATYEDILALPEHVTGEIIDGELLVSPRPAPKHSNAISVMGGFLSRPSQFGDGGPGGWWILIEPEMHLGEDVVVPDLAGWRRERLRALPDDPFLTLAPDWICEVLSPRTSRFDRTKKLPVYARAAVRNLWLIDPVAETLEAFELENGRWSLLATHGGDETVRVAPFEAIAMDWRRVGGRGE